jgi:hypothetical protein
MAYTADISNFEFGDAYKSAFAGKRVLITGSGKDKGIGQALALAAAANGAESVGVHFHSSYRDGFDLVDAIRDRGVNAFALQADVTSNSDLWASRSYIIEHMGGKSPDIIVCNSGLSEDGYRFGRALPEIEGESRAERRVRVRQSFMDNLRQSRLVMDTKIYGFVSWTHLWAGEAVYHKRPLQLVNLGSASDMVSACCIIFPFIRTGLTEAYADNPKVFGRWQSRMLETHEAAKSMAQLLMQPAGELNLGNFKLNVKGEPDDISLDWTKVRLEVEEDELGWGP